MNTLTREVLQRAQLVPTKHRFDVLALDGAQVQATVVERDELLGALAALCAYLEDEGPREVWNPVKLARYQRARELLKAAGQ